MRIEEPKKVKGFKIVHTIPDMTEEEREQKKKEILLKLYNYFTYNKKTLDTKVKNMIMYR